MSIVVVDYKLGNYKSVQNMLKKIGAKSILSADHQDILSAEKLILPGIGNFDQGMRNLHQYDLIDVLNEAVLEKNIPILGICMGFQLMLESSEESERPGLGWIKGGVKKFEFDSDQFKIPHVGWNDVSFAKNMDFESGYPELPRFYFSHSYYVSNTESGDTFVQCDYGGKFTAGVQKGNIMGVQFHPEKSHIFGMTFLKHFIAS